jgi:hypothetical protein
MSEFRSILERAGNALPPSDRGFDALHRRRDRQRRTKRITAGVVAVIVAAAGTATAFTALGPSPVRQGVGAEHFFALWPEDTYEEAIEAQTRADGGGFEWRLDPKEFASQFTQYVFGSVPTEINQCDPSDRFCFHQENAQGVSVRGPFGDLELNVARLVQPGEGGIWSLTAIYGEDLSIDASPDTPVLTGRKLEVTVRGNEPVVAAYRIPLSCGRGFAVAIPVLRQGGSSFIELPALPKCKGFLLLARGVGENGVGPLASGLFEAVPSHNCEPMPSAVFPTYCSHSVITDIAAVPVQFVPPPDGFSSFCAAPPFRPAYLPWLEEAQTVPEHRDYTDEGDRILRWDGPDDRYVSLVREGEVIGSGADATGSIRVFDHPAWMQWAGGGTGVGELVLSWEPASEPCGGYSLRLYDTSLSPEQAREEILKVAGSLYKPARPGYPSSVCHEDPAVCWVMYLWTGQNAEPFARELEAKGLARGEKFSIAPLGCEPDAAARLDRPVTDYAIAIFFVNRADAILFAERYDLIPLGILQVETVCLD